MKGLTNATSQDAAWYPKHRTAKWCCWFDGHFLTRPGSQKTWVFISLHRLQIRHSKILLILARPLPIGYFTFYYFSFFLIFNRMDAWSLMRGDAFIHFVSGSRRVNIRLGVLLLIPKSPHKRNGSKKKNWLKTRKNSLYSCPPNPLLWYGGRLFLKIHTQRNIWFSVGTRPNRFWEKGRGRKQYLTYGALASHTHRQQSSFNRFIQSFCTINSSTHQPRHNHQKTSFAQWKPYLKKPRWNEMIYVQRMKYDEG